MLSHSGDTAQSGERERENVWRSAHTKGVKKNTPETNPKRFILIVSVLIASVLTVSVLLVCVSTKGLPGTRAPGHQATQREWKIGHVKMYFPSDRKHPETQIK